MNQLGEFSASELQARAYGPNQPPLSDAELSQLRSLNQGSENDSGALAVDDPSARDRASLRRRVAGWSVAAGVSVVLAGSAGYAFGSSSPNTIGPESENFGSGIEVEHGDFRYFNDAACDLILSTDDASLTGAHCVWDDGAAVTLSVNSSEVTFQ